MESSLEMRYRRLKKRKRRNIILNTVCLLIAGSGLLWTVHYFWRYVNYEITNDAFIDQYISPVNVRVAGYVREIRFKEHQFVRQGDTLVVLETANTASGRRRRAPPCWTHRGRRTCCTAASSRPKSVWRNRKPT